MVTIFLFGSNTNTLAVEIIDEIKDLEGKVTLIVIAHRLTTLKYCNKIYRLEAGQIITEGSFEEVVGHTNS